MLAVKSLSLVLFTAGYIRPQSVESARLFSNMNMSFQPLPLWFSEALQSGDHLVFIKFFFFFFFLSDIVRNLSNRAVFPAKRSQDDLTWEENKIFLLHSHLNNPQTNFPLICLLFSFTCKDLKSTQVKADPLFPLLKQKNATERD